jgi:hypothetical protein
MSLAAARCRNSPYSRCRNSPYCRRHWSVRPPIEFRVVNLTTTPGRVGFGKLDSPSGKFSARSIFHLAILQSDRSQARECERAGRRRKWADQTSSHDATIVVSTDPLSAMYFEISLAVAAKALPGSQRRVYTGQRPKRGLLLNSLTSTTRTGRRASLRKR